MGERRASMMERILGRIEDRVEEYRAQKSGREAEIDAHREALWAEAAERQRLLLEAIAGGGGGSRLAGGGDPKPASGLCPAPQRVGWHPGGVRREPRPAGERGTRQGGLRRRPGHRGPAGLLAGLRVAGLANLSGRMPATEGLPRAGVDPSVSCTTTPISGRRKMEAERARGLGKLEGRVRGPSRATPGTGKRPG